MTRIVLLATLLIAAPIAAQTVFPPKVGSEYVFAFEQPCPAVDAGGVPLTAAAGSVSIVHSITGVQVACTAAPACDSRYEARVSVSDTGNRESYQGTAWTGDACTGEQSEASAETAYLYPGQGPRKPRLEP